MSAEQITPDKHLHNLKALRKIEAGLGITTISAAGVVDKLYIFNRDNLTKVDSAVGIGMGVLGALFFTACAYMMGRETREIKQVSKTIDHKG